MSITERFLLRKRTMRYLFTGEAKWIFCHASWGLQLLY